MGRVDDRRDERLQILRVHVFLRRVIVPAAGVVKIIPRANQMVGMPPRGGTAEPAGEEGVVLTQARIKILQQLARLRAVPQFPEEIDLRGDGRAMMDERRLRADGRGIDVQYIRRVLQIQFQQAQAGESGVPSIETIPNAPRRIMTDIAALHVNGINDAAQSNSGQKLLAELEILAGGSRCRAKHFFLRREEDLFIAGR